MSLPLPTLVRAPDAAALCWAAAEEVEHRAKEAVAARGAFTLALSGGSTPRALYELLADPTRPFRGRMPWTAVHAFFGDERAVPPDHPQSNYRMASEALLARVPLASVHRIEGERGAEEAAARYEEDLQRHFGAAAVPVFDLVLLGLGTDGHTASLFPGSPVLQERIRWVAASRGPPPVAERVTLTLPVLGAARAAVFLVSGRDKAGPLRRLLRPSPDENIPAARVHAVTSMVLADSAAAADLDPRP